MAETATEEALVIQGSDGAVYAIPRSQLDGIGRRMTRPR
jgi:hypothetical protein